MEVVDTTQINTFGTASPKANVSPSEESVFVLTGSQLQEIISRAIQPLQDHVQDLKDELSQLKVTIARQQEDIATLKTTEDQDFKILSHDISDAFVAIDEIDQRQQIKPQPLQKDRGEILRALIAVNGGKMLRSHARKKMHLSESRFSELLATMEVYIEVRPYHLNKNWKVLVLK
jgi:hypothetical protein